MKVTNCTIGDVCEVFDGPHATPSPSDEGPVYLGIPSILDDGSIDYENSKRISWEEFPKWAKRVTPQPGDVVFSYEANLDTYAIIPEGFVGCLGRRMAIMRPNKDKILSRYLYYYMLSPQWKAVIASKTVLGATVNRIPIATYPDFPIAIPDLETQQRIAGALSAYDELIENNRKQIKLLEEAAQRLYKEWFVDLKFPGHETTPIHNGLPEGWKRCHLRDVLEINGGKDYKQLKSGTYPVYGSGGLMCRVDSFLYEGESVLIPRKGTLNNVMYRNEAFWTVDTLFYTRVLLKNGGKYLFHAVRAFDFASMNIGAAVPSMTKTKLDGLVLTIPTELFLERFERAVAPFYQAMTVLQQQIAAAREARDRLLPKLMSGETAGCGR